MNILDITTTCNDPGLANILTIIKKILNLIQLLGPLLAIISLVVIFINMVNKPDEKKNFSKIKNSIIALVLTFFIPLIVDTAMFLVDENSTLSACWNNSMEKSTDSKYKNPNKKKKKDKKKPIIDSDKYETKDN